MRRYHLQNQTHLIEFLETPDGLTKAREFRRNRPAFRRRKIRAVLQLRPSQVPCGVVVERT